MYDGSIQGTEEAFQLDYSCKFPVSIDPSH